MPETTKPSGSGHSAGRRGVQRRVPGQAPVAALDGRRHLKPTAVPVRDRNGVVRAAMNVTVDAAETSSETLLREHLPRLLRTAGEISADWARWQFRPHVELEQRAAGPASA